MSEEKKKARPKPDHSSLPPPAILWTGRIFSGGVWYPSRLVAYYVWTLLADDEEWQAVLHVAYETALHQDHMGSLIFTDRPLTELPAQAFLDLCHRTGVR